MWMVKAKSDLYSVVPFLTIFESNQFVVSSYPLGWGRSGIEGMNIPIAAERA